MAIISVGPLLHRCGEADIPMPGGDRIGARPIDFHLNGLTLMGAKVKEQDNRYQFSAPDGLHGATIRLPFPSVMATENFLITASLAHGVTIIENAALEPEIIDLIKFLQKKQLGESVRDLGLAGEQEKKGTPTMGGLLFVGPIVVLMLEFWWRQSRSPVPSPLVRKGNGTFRHT